MPIGEGHTFDFADYGIISMALENLVEAVKQQTSAPTFQRGIEVMQIELEDRKLSGCEKFEDRTRPRSVTGVLAKFDEKGNLLIPRIDGGLEG